MTSQKGIPKLLRWRAETIATSSIYCVYLSVSINVPLTFCTSKYPIISVLHYHNSTCQAWEVWPWKHIEIKFPYKSFFTHLNKIRISALIQINQKKKKGFVESRKYTSRHTRLVGFNTRNFFNRFSQSVDM